MLYCSFTLTTGGRDRIDRHVVVTAVPQDDESSMDLSQKQVQGEVAIGRRHDGVNGIWIATADQIAGLLVNDIDPVTRGCIWEKALSTSRKPGLQCPRGFCGRRRPWSPPRTPSLRPETSPLGNSTTELWLGFFARSETNNPVSRSMSNLWSGITRWFAAPAMVGSRAVNPAYRPNTSSTMKRS